MKKDLDYWKQRAEKLQTERDYLRAHYTEAQAALADSVSSYWMKRARQLKVERNAWKTRYEEATNDPR